jgi:hypothetical protein
MIAKESKLLLVETQLLLIPLGVRYLAYVGILQNNSTATSYEKSTTLPRKSWMDITIVSFQHKTYANLQTLSAQTLATLQSWILRT